MIAQDSSNLRQTLQNSADQKKKKIRTLRYQKKFKNLIHDDLLSMFVV